MTFYRNDEPQSILLIGATGEAGLQCLRQLANHPSKPAVHAFCRDPSKLSNDDSELCQSIIKGNVRDTKEIEAALEQTEADLVIVAIGSGGDLSKSDIRSASGQALADAMAKPQFQNVCAVIVSSTGAGDSRIIVGLGMGSLISYHLRNVLADHTGQEKAFHKVQSRTLIVRATAFTDNKPTGKTVLFGATEKSPTIKIDRADLAAWITEEVTSRKPIGGKVVHITGVKSQ